MEQEAAPLIAGLGLVKDDPSRIPKPAPCLTYSGSYAGIQILVVCNGVYHLLCMASGRRIGPSSGPFPCNGKDITAAQGQVA